MADQKDAGQKPARTKSEEPAEAPEPRPFISEGVRAEIEQRGQAVDPATGRVLTRKDLP